MKMQLALHRFFVRLLRWGPLAAGLLVAFFLPPILAGTAAAVGLVWAFGTHTDIRTLLITLYLAVITGIVANGIVQVAPLPQGRLTTTSGAVTKPLISLTDSAWYVAQLDHSIRFISAAQVKVGIFATSERRNRSVLALLEGLI